MLIMNNIAEREPWTAEEVDSKASTAGKVGRNVTLYFNGIRTSFSASPLVAELLPKGRGESQEFIGNAVVELWKHMLPHLETYEMALSTGEMIDDLRSYYDTTQSDVISTAIVWWSGKQSRT